MKISDVRIRLVNKDDNKLKAVASMDNFNSVYFIGVGGVSMSGLASFMLSLGKKVGGCDLKLQSPF
mgnify:CR=1 FL=1